MIEALEAEREALRLRTAGPEFYKESADAIREALARLEAIDPELAAAYERWNALDARACRMLGRARDAHVRPQTARGMLDRCELDSWDARRR